MNCSKKIKLGWRFTGAIILIICLATALIKWNRPPSNRVSIVSTDRNKSSYFHDGATPLANRNQLEQDTPNRSTGSTMITVEEFLEKFNSIDIRLSGLELRQERSRVINLAASSLSIDELKKLSDMIRNKVYHSELSGHLASRYATENPTEGLEWLIQESKWADKSSATLAYARSCKFDSFPTDDLDRFQNDEKKAMLIQGMMKSASVNVATSAIEYLNTHSNVNNQNGVLMAECFSPILKAGQFNEALILCDHLNDKAEKLNMIGIIFSSACVIDPKAAKDLLANIGDESERTSAITNLANAWGTSEPDKVATWANGLSTLREQDAAKEGLIKSIFHSDPASALEWAQSIGDKEKREAVIAKLTETLRITDPELVK